MARRQEGDYGSYSTDTRRLMFWGERRLEKEVKQQQRRVSRWTRIAAARAEKAKKVQEEATRIFGIYALLSPEERQEQICKSLGSLDNQPLKISAQKIQMDEAIRPVLTAAGIENLPVLLVSPNPLPKITIKACGNGEGNIVLIVPVKQHPFIPSQEYHLCLEPFPYFEIPNSEKIRVDGSPLNVSDGLQQHYLALWFAQAQSLAVPFEASLLSPSR